MRTEMMCLTKYLNSLTIQSFETTRFRNDNKILDTEIYEKFYA